MPPTQDVFGMAVLLLGLTALGLSVIFEASRLSAVAGRQALLRRRAQSRQREKLELKLRLDSGEAEIAAKQMKLDAMMAERSRIIAATTALKLSKIEMVHEIGEPESGMALFQGDLRTTPEQSRADQRRIVFAKEIWERSNIAHVWAETPESAMAAIQRAFTARSGIVASRLQRAALPKIAGPTSDSGPVAAPTPPAATPATPVLRAPATASSAAATTVVQAA
jgi:hypothetical protein